MVNNQKDEPIANIREQRQRVETNGLYIACSLAHRDGPQSPVDDGHF